MPHHQKSSAKNNQENRGLQGYLEEDPVEQIGETLGQAAHLAQNVGANILRGAQGLAEEVGDRAHRNAAHIKELGHEVEEAAVQALRKGQWRIVNAYHRCANLAHRWTRHLHTPRLALALTVLMLACASWMNYKQAQVEEYARGFELVDTRYYALPHTVATLLLRLGPAGRQEYASFLWIDNAFAVLSSTWLSVLLAGLSSSVALAGLPYVALFADWAENALLLRLIRRFPSAPPMLEYLLALCVSVKWIILYSSLALVLLGSLARATGFSKSEPLFRSGRRMASDSKAVFVKRNYSVWRMQRGQAPAS